MYAVDEVENQHKLQPHTKLTENQRCPCLLREQKNCGICTGSMQDYEQENVGPDDSIVSLVNVEVTIELGAHHSEGCQG
jgi:hypothetical protein